MRGPIYFNKKLIEEEVKFYIDLTLAINSVNGKTKFQEGTKKEIIDKLSVQAAEGIYGSLGLKEYACGAGWTRAASGRIVKRVDPDDIILDCSVDEFVDKGYGPVKMDVGNKIVGHDSSILKEIPDKIKMLKAAKEEMKKEMEKKTKCDKVVFTDIKKKVTKKRKVKEPAKKSKKAKVIKKVVKKNAKKKVISKKKKG